jgi:PKD repeat protein
MPDTAYVGQALTFSSCTQNANTFVWNFGDGTDATTARAIHTYTAAGIYPVTFTPLNSFGAGSAKKFNITVIYAGPAGCIASVPDSAYVGQSVTFTSCTQGATSYLWDFGDGNTATTASATHSYTAPGTYTGSFTPSDVKGTGTPKAFTIVVTIYGGSWTFMGGSYTAVTCTQGVKTLIASSQTSGNSNTFGTLVVYFYNAIPTTSGTYTVVYPSNQYLPTQVGMYLTTEGVSEDTYYSTGGNGSNQTVRVTVLNGKLSIAGSGIEFGNGFDSGSVNIHINQTQ